MPDGQSRVSTYSPAVEAAFPRLGVCAFCGADDQRHRVIDAIAERFRAGESAAEIAEDYGIDAALVPVIAAEPATRIQPPLWGTTTGRTR